MKKFLKFLGSLIAIVSVIGGAYYVIKNFFLNDVDDFDDFDDDFDDFDDSDAPSDNRGYVTLNSTEDGTDTNDDDEFATEEATVHDNIETDKKEDTVADKENNTKKDDDDFLIEE